MVYYYSISQIWSLTT